MVKAEEVQNENNQFCMEYQQMGINWIKVRAKNTKTKNFAKPLPAAAERATSNEWTKKRRQISDDPWDSCRLKSLAALWALTRWNKAKKLEIRTNYNKIIKKRALKAFSAEWDLFSNCRCQRCGNVGA